MKKFDYAIGNPPYQADRDDSGDNKGYSAPVYNYFLDSACMVASKVEMIHPARFLFNAGSTSKSWNIKMLNDEHYKILDYEQDSKKMFPSLVTPIKGGVAISYWDSSQKFNKIETFTQYIELNSLLLKVKNDKKFESFSGIVVTRTAYRLTNEMHKDYPEAINQLSNGHAYDMSTNIFDRLPQVFLSKVEDDENYIKILGRENNKRVYKFIKRKYISTTINTDKFKVFLPKANNSGMFGEALALPTIEYPGTGSTESFISVGAFEDIKEAKNCLKYLKCKFTRSLLSVLKTTQDLTPAKFKYVPLQDFTSKSDIDWSKSVHEIDLQLYKKYKLDKNEIEFIESHVKEMK